MILKQCTTRFHFQKCTRYKFVKIRKPDIPCYSCQKVYTARAEMVVWILFFEHTKVPFCLKICSKKYLWLQQTKKSAYDYLLYCNIILYHSIFWCKNKHRFIWRNTIHKNIDNIFVTDGIEKCYRVQSFDVFFASYLNFLLVF